MENHTVRRSVRMTPVSLKPNICVSADSWLARFSDSCYLHFTEHPWQSHTYTSMPFTRDKFSLKMFWENSCVYSVGRPTHLCRPVWKRQCFFSVSDTIVSDPCGSDEVQWQNSCSHLSHALQPDVTRMCRTRLCQTRFRDQKASLIQVWTGLNPFGFMLLHFISKIL